MLYKYISVCYINTSVNVIFRYQCMLHKDISVCYIKTSVYVI